jgi:hypothetical protein
MCVGVHGSDFRHRKELTISAEPALKEEDRPTFHQEYG